MSNASDTAIEDLRNIFAMRRKAFLVYVDLDPVPGTFHTPYSAYLNVSGILENNIGHYKPVVVLASEVTQRNEDTGRRRVCFVLYVDLDSNPGEFHTQESAQITITGLLDRISHYNPLVSPAPDSVQPINIVEGNN